MTAEASADLFEDLKESVNCAVCLELLNDPRSLPCQHSFCLDCLQGVQGQGESICCPVCKDVVYVPNGVWELPKDFRANTWLGKLSDYQKASVVATRAKEEDTRDIDVQVVRAEGVSVEPCPTCQHTPSHRLCVDCLGFLWPSTCESDRVRFSTCSCSTTALPPLNSEYEITAQGSQPVRVSEDKLTFDLRHGSNVSVHANQITVHRNNAYSSSKPSIVLTSRHLEPNEIFEVRLEKKVKIYEGSMIIGVTTHSARHINFPPTITNVPSGTWVFSGEQVLKNGRATHSQYGQNLHALEVGSRVGVQRRDDGSLHFYVDGVDQGVAASGVPAAVYGAIDLLGNAQQASIVDYSGDRPEQGQLTFHPRCGTEAVVHANQITAHRNNPLRTFSDGVVMTSRTLKDNELCEIRLDKMVRKWQGSIVIGLTTHSPGELEFPSCIRDIRPGTWMLSNREVKWNGSTIKERYGKDLDTLKEGDRVGVQRTKKGKLHFYINGVDQGVAGSNIPAAVHGVIDLHGDAVQATLMDTSGLQADDASESRYKCSIC